MHALRTIGLMLAVMLLAAQAFAGDVPRMTKEELKAQLDDATVVVVDVRRGSDWRGSEFKIKGAERPEDVAAYAKEQGLDKTFVFYCA